MRELETRLNKVSSDPTSYSEKKRLKDIIEDKNHQIDQLRRDEDSLKDQVSYYRREVSEKEKLFNEKVCVLMEVYTADSSKLLCARKQHTNNLCIYLY